MQLKHLSLLPSGSAKGHSTKPTVAQNLKEHRCSHMLLVSDIGLSPCKLKICLPVCWSQCSQLPMYLDIYLEMKATDYKLDLVRGTWLLFRVGLKLEIHLNKPWVPLLPRAENLTAAESPWGWGGGRRGSTVAFQRHTTLTQRHGCTLKHVDWQQSKNQNSYEQKAKANKNHTKWLDDVCGSSKQANIRFHKGIICYL